MVIKTSGEVYNICDKKLFSFLTNHGLQAHEKNNVIYAFGRGAVDCVNQGLNWFESLEGYYFYYFLQLRWYELIFPCLVNSGIVSSENANYEYKRIFDFSKNYMYSHDKSNKFGRTKYEFLKEKYKNLINKF